MTLACISCRVALSYQQLYLSPFACGSGPNALHWAASSVTLNCRQQSTLAGGHNSEASSSESRSTWAKNKAEKEKRLREKISTIKAKTAAQETTTEDEKKQWKQKETFLYDLPTLPGEKKDTSMPLPQSYSPHYVEACWYSWWQKQGFFKPEWHSKQPHAKVQFFSLCIPPPNVTGSLHLGHALTVAIEDALTRWKRMQGCKVLWVPGCDHAGIATQAVVERKLLKERGLLRHELGREEFLQEVWRWKDEKGDEIYQQLKRLGASLDWDRACFTMDHGFSDAVTEAFVRLYDAGLIYRSRQLVNWSCALKSTISDIEVESQSLSGRTYLSVPGYEEKLPFGEMITFAYRVQDSGEEVDVATTRPETMVGDVAVAVHPDDQRYTHLHNKMLEHPFTGRLMPVLPEASVDKDLGTGAVKVTPAHDYADYEIGLKHKLPVMSVIGEDGTMTVESIPWLKGLKRFHARKKVIDALKEKGLFRGSKDHSMVLPLCSRSGDVIEPLMKSQWFVNCQLMAEKAMEAVDTQHLQLLPKFYEKKWRNWLSQISDWCISRQLWWGHQIPAYKVSFPGSEDIEKSDSGSLWIVGRTQAEARSRAAETLKRREEELTLHRDPDVLDTWFSSGLFPFAMLGWPKETADLKDFYPNSILETGSDLIFFWVARMVMLGQQLTGQLPFSQVYFHSMVRDAHGRKMSKSLGNVIDPLDVISGITLQRLHEKLQEGNLDPQEMLIAQEGQKKDFPMGIPECGTDALRFALCSFSSQGEDIKLDIGAVLSTRHFCNKVWNAMKFTLAALGEDFVPQPVEMLCLDSAIDRWICSRLHHAVSVCNHGFQHYNFHAVTKAVHSFWLHSLCDVYLECVKPVLQSGYVTRVRTTQQVLYSCIETALHLLSPFMPYLTEELWQRLPRRTGETAPSICVARFPSTEELVSWHCPEEEVNFQLVQDVVHVVRSLRADYQLTKAHPKLYISCSQESTCHILELYHDPLQVLSRSRSVRIFMSGEDVPNNCAVGIVNDQCQVYMALEGQLDFQKELCKLQSRLQKLEEQLAAAVYRTQVTGYDERVPAAVQQEHSKKILALQTEVEKIKLVISHMQQMVKNAT
ncbi:valine--tRNA ligase, mitochondrial [Protopterus annectens]|uniref:valine--tRNA ligase, mitochondrial n=1 Tax=Protopterus annectens TaxID=7888 RepID=UPI001CFAB39C|nr:valine--tRNA ligase, mitochondrial [Protopterus annectens]XP_043940398.1 valine--tRNA ligase, mitochondrial [Protopterus annectens]